MSTAAIVPDHQWQKPATEDSKESLTRVQNIIGDFDTEYTMKYYDYWSEHYEKDLQVLEYNVPNVMTECVQKNIEDGKLSDKECKVLDIGAGTGQMAIALNEITDYKGVIDAVDGNSKMLAKAVEKSLYRNHLIHILLEDKPMPIANNTYDSVVCCCAMVPGLIQPECLPDMVRVTKKGGIFCFTTRATDGNGSFLDRVKNQINQLESKGLIEVFDKQVVPQYSWPVGMSDEQKAEMSKHCISAVLYGIRKLTDS